MLFVREFKGSIPVGGNRAGKEVFHWYWYIIPEMRSDYSIGSSRPPNPQIFIHITLLLDGGCAWSKMWYQARQCSWTKTILRKDRVLELFTGNTPDNWGSTSFISKAELSWWITMSPIICQPRPPHFNQWSRSPKRCFWNRGHLFFHSLQSQDTEFRA